ncbi:hypothetical protein QJS10_CPB04g00373 [Acorus calamus]|uniref:Cytochrome b561 domain-containing protein n=1 Tax=Acorus calamus TaxID=4465 RepID=A0AAV9F275_ACOCL|nr:hypothetical protein QJS10_CPB04g00373 [Acorus calamus]
MIVGGTIVGLSSICGLLSPEYHYKINSFQCHCSDAKYGHDHNVTSPPFLVLTLLLKPRKEHKYRPYWELCHQAIGYAAIVMRVVDVFKGLGILKPDQKWRTCYIVVVSVLGVTAVALEAINLVMTLVRKKSTNAAEPYDGASIDLEIGP